MYHSSRRQFEFMDEIFDKFFIGVNSVLQPDSSFKNGVYLTHTLHQRFPVDSIHYDNDELKRKVEMYLTNVVIPHKIAVCLAGFEIMSSGYITKYLTDSEVNQFEYNLLIHDLSKFSANEVFGYCFYDRSTGYGAAEFEKAWHHHKMNNPHHPEYWFNPNRQGVNEPIAMPAIYVLEMVADWIGAGKTYGSTLQDWLPKNLIKFRFGESTHLVSGILADLGIQTKSYESGTGRPILDIV